MTTVHDAPIPVTEDDAASTPSLDAAQAEALINSASGGSAAARDQLLIALYPSLRNAAARLLHQESQKISLRPTELLHEAALKLIRLDRMSWQDRAHFTAICCTVMRQVIVDRARWLNAAKRRHQKVTTSWLSDHAVEESVDAEALDAALGRLAVVSPDHSRLVELRFFGGLTLQEIAHVMGRSDRTIKRQWQSARAWLLQAMTET